MQEVREPSARYLVDLQPAVLRRFELLATAPEGVGRLRELILSLAVRGRLFPQQATGEPVGADAADSPCALPRGWQWTRLSDLGEFRGGKTPSTQRADYWDGAIPWITPKDMKQLHLSDSQDHVTTKATEDGLALIPSGSLLIVVRSGILRRTVPTAINDVETTINQDLKALVFARPQLAPYVQLLVRGFEAFILENLTKVGTTVESIQFDAFASQPFPLPPLAEQARIVARVDELMRLCDALEAKGRLEAEQHARLLSTVLATLTDSRSPEELAANWQRVAAHFDLLLDRPEAVDALEQTILGLAVRGALVPQDDADRPARELLERICAEKGSNVPEGKIARDATSALVADQDTPFDIPTGWGWVRLGAIATIERGGSPRPIQAFLTTAADGLNWIKIGDTEKGGKYIFATREKIRKEGLSKTRKVYPGDFLLTNSMSFGRPYITQIEGCIHDGWLRISPSRALSKDYLYLLLSSPFIRQCFEAAAAGGVVLNLNADKVRSVPIPLPPMEEQARIAARADQLGRLCADLRQRLAASRAMQARLADAIVELATAT